MTEFMEAVSDMPPLFWIGLFFLFGSFVGSFLNVVVFRLPRNCLSINNPKRSFCPSCKTQLTWKDNLPIIGWLILRGKCAYCGVKFGARYPMVELLTAALFAFAASRVLYADGNVAGDPWSWLTLLHVLCMIGVLLPWALIDLDLTLIPDKLTLGPLIVFIPFSASWRTLDFGLASASTAPDLTQPVVTTQPAHEILHLLFSFEPLWLNSLLSAVITGVGAALTLWLMGKFFNVIFAARVKEMGGESMGFGDVKLMILLGMMLGWPKLLAAFFLAIFFGAVIGSFQIVFKKQHGTPFGPYLAFGALASALVTPWLTGIYEWYIGLLEGFAR